MAPIQLGQQPRARRAAKGERARDGRNGLVFCRVVRDVQQGFLESGPRKMAAPRTDPSKESHLELTDGEVIMPVARPHPQDAGGVTHGSVEIRRPLSAEHRRAAAS